MTNLPTTRMMQITSDLVAQKLRDAPVPVAEAAPTDAKPSVPAKQLHDVVDQMRFDVPEATDMTRLKRAFLQFCKTIRATASETSESNEQVGLWLTTSTERFDRMCLASCLAVQKSSPRLRVVCSGTRIFITAPKAFLEMHTWRRLLSMMTGPAASVSPDMPAWPLEAMGQDRHRVVIPFTQTSFPALADLGEEEFGTSFDQATLAAVVLSLWTRDQAAHVCVRDARLDSWAQSFPVPALATEQDAARAVENLWRRAAPRGAPASTVLLEINTGNSVFLPSGWRILQVPEAGQSFDLRLRSDARGLCLDAADDVLSQEALRNLGRDIAGHLNGLVAERRFSRAFTQVQTAVEVVEPPAVEDLTPAIPSADRNVAIPATYDQARLLEDIHDRDSGTRIAASVMRPINLRKVNIPAVEAALEVLYERHEVLHTCFVEAGGTHYVSLDDSAPVPLTRIGWLRLDGGLETAAKHQISLGLQQESEVRHGPLWKADLMCQGAHATLVCMFAEAIVDPASTEMLRTEFLALYAAFQTGEDPESEAHGNALQFTDFAAHVASNANWIDEVDWWQSKIGHLDAGDEVLPFTRTAPVETFDHVLNKRVTARLSNFAQMQGVSEEAILLSAFFEVIVGRDKSGCPWVLVSGALEKPEQMHDVPGPWTRRLAVYVDPAQRTLTPGDIARRLTDVRRFGAVPEAALQEALIDHVPARLPYVFDWREDFAAPVAPLMQEDVLLRVYPEDQTLRLQWSFRKDHPFSRNAPRVARAFMRQLKIYLRG